MEANKFSPIKSDVHIFLEQKQPIFLLLQEKNQ